MPEKSCGYLMSSIERAIQGSKISGVEFVGASRMQDQVRLTFFATSPLCENSLEAISVIEAEVISDHAQNVHFQTEVIRMDSIDFKSLIDGFDFILNLRKTFRPQN